VTGGIAGNLLSSQGLIPRSPFGAGRAIPAYLSGPGIDHRLIAVILRTGNCDNGWSNLSAIRQGCTTI